MSPFTAFILGTAFGIVMLVFLLSWAVWKRMEATPKKQKAP